MPPHATAQNPMDEMLVTCPWCVDGTPGQGVLCTHLSPPVDNRCVEDDSARRLRCVALSDALLTFLAPELPQRIPVIKTASCEGRCYTVIHTSQGRGRCRTSANGRSVAVQAHGVADRHLRRGHGADITSPWQQMLCCISPRSSLRCGSWAYRQGVGIACACLLIGFLILAMPRLKVRPVCRRWGLQRPGGSSGRTRMRRHDTQVRWQQMLRVRVQQKLAELEEELKKRC